jgi:hypothetical protein
LPTAMPSRLSTMTTLTEDENSFDINSPLGRTGFDYRFDPGC